MRRTLRSKSTNLYYTKEEEEENINNKLGTVATPAIPALQKLRQENLNFKTLPQKRNQPTTTTTTTKP
jgi:hypothetical protein